MEWISDVTALPRSHGCTRHHIVIIALIIIPIRILLTAFFLPHSSYHRMELNCNGSRLALIDAPGIMSLLDLEAKIPEDEERYCLFPPSSLLISLFFSLFFYPSSLLLPSFFPPHLLLPLILSPPSSHLISLFFPPHHPLCRDPEDRSIIGQFFGRKLPLERRDVWDVRWSEDDEEMLCVMEKTKMVRARCLCDPCSAIRYP